MLEQQEPDLEMGLDARPTLVAGKRRDLAVELSPIDLAGKLYQLVLHVDDLIEPGPLNRSVSLVDETLRENATAVPIAGHANRSRRLIKCVKDCGR